MLIYYAGEGIKMTQTALLLLALVLLFMLSRSFSNDPFSYRNILLTSAVVFIVSMLLDETYGLPTRFLTIPLCLLSFFICISNVVLLKREGFRLHNFLGFIFMGAYLIVTNILWYRFDTVPIPATPFVFFIRLLVCYSECTIIAIWIMGYAVLCVKPSYDRDFIIILGCSISRKGKLRPLIKGRVNKAIRFAWEQEWNVEKSALYVPSGGQGKDEPMSEGSAMEMYLISHGAEDYEVHAEKESRNTRENIIFSKRIIDGLKKDARIAVVTTNYHVLRSGMLAKREGVDAQLIGSTTKWYFWPNAFMRETVAIFFMYRRIHLAAGVLSALIAATFMFLL